MIDNRYDGRMPEPPYECPSCTELRTEVEMLIKGRATLLESNNDQWQIVVDRLTAENTLLKESLRTAWNSRDDMAKLNTTLRAQVKRQDDVKRMTFILQNSAEEIPVKDYWDKKQYWTKKARAVSAWLKGEGCVCRMKNGVHDEWCMAKGE